MIHVMPHIWFGKIEKKRSSLSIWCCFFYYCYFSSIWRLTWSSLHSSCKRPVCTWSGIEPKRSGNAWCPAWMCARWIERCGGVYCFCFVWFYFFLLCFNCLFVFCLRVCLFCLFVLFCLLKFESCRLIIVLKNKIGISQTFFGLKA